MRAQEHPSVWRTHLGIGWASNCRRWSHQLRSWWTAHHAARHHARLAALDARWDATREAVRPLPADAARDLIAPTHAHVTAAALSTLAV
jgi:hypothetical protein